MESARIVNCVFILFLIAPIIGGDINNNEYDQNVARHRSKTDCMNDHIWTVWENDTCKCGDDLNGLVTCDTITFDVRVTDCFCLTKEFDAGEGREIPIVGCCIFNCLNTSYVTSQDAMYREAPSNCASLNRQGTLCGQCMDGYTVPAYSYDIKCIRCDSNQEYWGVYIVVAFIPLTVFIITIFLFRINVLAPKIFIFVFSAQAVSSPAIVRAIFNFISLRGNPLIYRIPAVVLSTLYGIWNFDFFRVNIFPGICIDASPIQILMLDYLIAIYPLMLMTVMYIMVQIHSFGFETVLCVWRPFHRFLARFRRHWGIETSIIDAFATFFFLSTTKILSVSFTLLMGTSLHTSNGSLYSLRMFYDANVLYMGKEHISYAAVAISVFIAFFVFPMSLLFCYQCRSYRKCLTRCQIQGPTLDEFVRTFQKYYKDGSPGTRDCRWFAGVNISLKILLYLNYSIFANILAFPTINIIVIFCVIIIVLVEPFKEEYSAYNILSANLFLWVSLLFSTMMYGYMSASVQLELWDCFMSAVVMMCFPLFYLIAIILSKIISRFRNGNDVLVSSLPHRMLYSKLYKVNLEQNKKCIMNKNP